MEGATVSTEETVVIPQIVKALSVVHGAAVVLHPTDNESEISLHSVIESAVHPVLVRGDYPVRFRQTRCEVVPDLPIVDVLVWGTGFNDEGGAKTTLVDASIGRLPAASVLRGDHV